MARLDREHISGIDRVAAFLQHVQPAAAEHQHQFVKLMAVKQIGIFRIIPDAQRDRHIPVEMMVRRDEMRRFAGELIHVFS
ncbi:hypothetical protein [Victivallis vadensis]|uniref:hypothetical protein n=1 Tax=Victivallis vadensis TaxID=172901 RepID=UPI00266BE2DB|nr:hypothetical protein [Victivallis vadensis]